MGPVSRQVVSVSSTIADFLSHPPEDFQVLMQCQNIVQALKWLYGQQGFCGFSISKTSKKGFEPKIWIPMLFCHIIKL